MNEIRLFPKQAELLDQLEHGKARILGLGGGRGASKSSSIDRVALTLALENPGIVLAIVMRNADQVRKYHVEPIMRTWPDLQQWMHYSHNKLIIPHQGKPSQLDFTYSESMEDTKRRFRSANYKFMFLDQSEMWMGEEIREMMNANRGTSGAKTVLSFNLGGIGIQDHKNWFHDRKYNERDTPENYSFIKINPWDNVVWAYDALKADGLTEEDYYGWTDAQRFDYFVRFTEYGRQLNSLDDAIRNRDLLGDWNSLEGAYFGRVFDYKATLISSDTAQSVLRPWDPRWISTDWGKTHFCSSHWHGRTLLSPLECRKMLGWDVPRPLNVVVTYRRMIVNEQTSTQVGKALVDATPLRERERIMRYFLSPDAFGNRDSEHTTADLLTMEMRRYGMPQAERADNTRKPGWQLMYTLLNNTRIWADPSRTAEMMAEAGDTVWLISSECPELLDTIPLLMRNEKDLDDIVKTDMSQTDLKMDVADDVRYGLLSMLAEGIKPQKALHAEQMLSAWERNRDATQLNMMELEYQAAQRGPQFSVTARRR